MSDATVRLRPITVPLNHIFLDPNNPRFAKSLNLPAIVPDNEVEAVQHKLEKLFINEKDSEVGSDDGETDAEEGAVRIGDLVRSMGEIGFVPIDRIVVRALPQSPGYYVVIEGNRRVRTAKFLASRNADGTEPDPEKRRRLASVAATFTALDVLLLEDKGLSAQQLHDQVGVILGLRHFGQVLGWGVLAKAVNIYHEYLNTSPVQLEFKLDTKRISQVVTRLSESRAGVMSALKTYIAYRQLQEAFPNGPPKPSHFSLLQACVTNRKLAAANFIEQDDSSFLVSEASLGRINETCEFETRDAQVEDEKILNDPKAVSAFAGIVADATSHADSAIKAFAASLLSDVIAKERTLSDAVDNLRSFKIDRKWTDSLAKLLDNVAVPGEEIPEPKPGEAKTQLTLDTFSSTGNDLLHLEEARKAFKNVRVILGI